MENNNIVSFTRKQIRTYSFIMLGLVTVPIGFIYYFNNHQINKLEESKLLNKKDEQNAIAQRKKLQEKSIEVENQLYFINGKLEVQNHKLEIQNKVFGQFQKDYGKSLIQLKQFKNEQIYVPTTATIEQQSTYISNYNYKPY